MDRSLRKKGIKKATVSICLILSGIFLYICYLIFNFSEDTFLYLGDISIDAQVLGYSLLAYSLCSFNNLKLKAFTFMMCLWRSFVLISNPLEFFSLYPVIVFNSIFLYWLYRVYFIDNNKVSQMPPDTEVFMSGSYNVFFPISSFRGLLKSLFVPLSDAYYETTLLVHKDYIYCVRLKEFVRLPYLQRKIKKMVGSGDAYIQSCNPTEKQIIKIEKLVGKRSITGLRDCRKLKITSTTNHRRF